MYLDKEKKEEIFGKFSHNGNAADTGSAESQIALFSYRIACDRPFTDYARW